MASAPYRAYGAIGLISDSPTSLDKITTSGLEDSDVAVAIENDKIYFYIIKEDSGEDQNVPYIVKPEDETGNKRWVLISQEVYTTDIIQLVDNYIQTSHIKAIDNNTIEIEASNGNKVIVHKNGEVTFPSYVSVSTSPTENSHLANKGYVDTEYSNKETQLKNYTDSEVSSKDTELRNYADSEFASSEASLKSYVDNQVSSAETDLKSYVDNEVNDKDTELRSYVDTESNSLDSELTQYVDDEYDKVINNVYPIQKFTISDWLESGGLYYNDIYHQKGYTEIIVRCWDGNGFMLYPYNIESIDSDTARI